MPEEAPAKTALPPETGSQKGSYVGVGHADAVNASALEELEEMGKILENIELPYISLHCALYFPDRDPAELFRDLIYYLRHKKYDLAKIQGSVDFDPLFDWSDPPIKPLIRLLHFVSERMPGFRVLQVNSSAFNTGPECSDSELALTIAKGAE